MDGEMVLYAYLQKRLEELWDVEYAFACHEMLYGIPCGPPYTQQMRSEWVAHEVFDNIARAMTAWADGFDQATIKLQEALFKTKGYFDMMEEEPEPKKGSGRIPASYNKKAKRK